MVRTSDAIADKIFVFTVPQTIGAPIYEATPVCDGIYSQFLRCWQDDVQVSCPGFIGLVSYDGSNAQDAAITLDTSLDANSVTQYGTYKVRINTAPNSQQSLSETDEFFLYAVDCETSVAVPASDSITVLGGTIDLTTTIDPTPDANCGTLALSATYGVNNDPIPEFMVQSDYTLTITPTEPTHVGVYELNLQVDPSYVGNPFSYSVSSTITILPCVITDFSTDSGVPIDDISYVIEGTQISVDILAFV